MSNRSPYSNRRYATMLAPLAFVTGCSAVLGMESSYDLRPTNATPASTGSNDPAKECVPGDFRCSEADLESCEGGRFRLWKTCVSAAKCSATGGNCDGLYCTSGQHRCRGDALERCTDDLSQFVFVEGCGVGLCDAVAKRCNVCVPLSRSCMDGTTLAECAADGLVTSSTICPPGSARCVDRSSGSACVECGEDSHCTQAPPVCRKASCANGACTTVPDPAQQGKIVQAQQQGSCTHSVCRNGISQLEQVPVGTDCDIDQYGNGYSCNANGQCVLSYSD